MGEDIITPEIAIQIDTIASRLWPISFNPVTSKKVCTHFKEFHVNLRSGGWVRIFTRPIPELPGFELGYNSLVDTLVIRRHDD